jgi:ABC-type polysaccharide/polyol phosphate transport system ATPase subunit
MASIILNDVAVNYPVYALRNTHIRHALLSFATGGRIFSEANRVSYVEALQHINFELKDGDRLGLIGHNGAGKSTLLKTIAGFIPASKGTITVNGSVTVLFNISNGLDVDKTGYENIRSMGLLLGMSEARIKELIPEIEDFCELGEFLYLPVRTYSDGMRLRLSFAVSTAINPEILVMDEAIGAGDAQFMKKAAARARALYQRASIIIMASHSEGVIRDFCNKAILLQRGQIAFMGDVDDAIAAYRAGLQ